MRNAHHRHRWWWRSRPTWRVDRAPGGRAPRVRRLFPAGEFGVPCALIIGERTAATDLKTSLNDTLREFAVSV